MRTSSPKAIAPLRRLLASASLGAAAVGIGAMAFEWRETAPLVAAGVIGVGALGLSRRSVLVQVFSRGVGWLVLTPALLGVASMLLRGHVPDVYTAALAATSGSALLLARPALHTESARAEFAPVGYRKVFLAGAVASAMTACVAALFAYGQLFWDHRTGAGVALAAFAAALVGSVVGVVRMRAWGVLLAIVSSAAALIAALLTRDHDVAVALGLMASPGLLLASPLVAARLRPPPQAPSVRVPGRRDGAVEQGEDAPPPVLARVRVVAEAEEELAEAGQLAVGQK